MASKPAAKTPATKAPAKKTAAPASKAKAAPAPAPEEAEEAYGQGDFVVFQGYDESVPEADRLIEEGTVLEIAELPTEDTDEATGEPIMGGYGVQVPNPDFDESKKPGAKNPEFITVEVFPEEIRAATQEEVDAAYPAEEGEGEAEPEAEAEPEVTDVEPKPAKGKTAAAPAAKGKAAAKAPTKRTVTQEESEGEADVDALESEDEEILAMVDGLDTEGLIAKAQEVESQTAMGDYQLGGLLHHIKLDGGWKDLDKGAYAGKGGFALFCQSYFNIDYRKAQTLIDIYTTFHRFGLENPAEFVAQVGWSKASKITKPIREGQQSKKQIKALMKLATDTPHSDLTSVINEQLKLGNSGEGAGSGETVTRTTIKFRAEQGKAQVVLDAIAAVKEKTGITDDFEALYYIVGEYATLGGGESKAKAAPAAKTAATAKPAARPAARVAAR